ncbi:hypothetical protein [Actinoplanes teichomyceticus]|uniref:Methyltransferase family protein n=1 Tax=Actinoplanes teichomyceticus TaxID=1867 RepID=A0A561WJZ4_ACTTI|nr:hypothetical protein [Actinoplanes teichomyceticus]TWG24153.1 hypothetical protein FHX34_102706 [Actinoplanes teichomyceticus]GIF13003.1 hypothetical protein Ate01nite_30350 [Actinoplanes teichomyceticus]
MSVRLLGGEMPHWSEPVDTGARGAVLAALAAAAHGRTLVVGPHGAEVVDPLTAGELTLLVRGTPDAEALARRYATRPGVRVWCGSLDKLAAEPEFDTVLALDGLDRTGSTESPELPWSQALARLLAVLRPGGRLLLGLPNPAGLHRLVALPAEPGVTEWPAPAEDDPTRPVSLSELHAAVRSAGLEVLRGYAAFPSPDAPSALLGAELLADPRMRGLLQSTLRRALVPAAPLLADPRPIAMRLLHAGLAGPTAPGWVVVATRPGGPARPDLPGALIGTGPAGVDRVEHDPARGWLRVGAGAARVVPAGRCLHDVLLAAARGHDHPAFRGLLTAWQAGALAGVDADEIVVDPDGLLHGLGRPLDAPAPLAAGPAAPEPTSAEVATAEDTAAGPAGSRRDGEALRRFARAMFDEGLSHLWPTPADESEVTALLAEMAGRVAPDRAADAHDGPPTLRETVAQRDRLRRELAEARAQADWYERRAARRDAELIRANRIISALKATAPGRAATVVAGGLRTGKRVARAALRRLRPDG